MSSIHGSLPQQQKSTTPATAHSTTNEDDSGLTQSLSQLSLTNEPTISQAARRASATSNTPLRPTNQPSSSASPRPRNPSRSPSNGPDARRGSRAGTPPLLRKASMTSLHSANGVGSAKQQSRRASSGQLMSPSMATTEEEEKPEVTANSIASEWFEAELEAFHGPGTTLPTDTIVILNDAVYGHRFSRPRTSRNALGTIVERPERIKATVLGVSAAYVRLGGRHADGAFPIRPKRNVRDIDSIPFRIQKTTRRLPLTSLAVTNVHGTKWMEELKLMCESAETRLALGGKELQRPDIPRGLDDPTPQKLHEGDLYLCSESLNAMEGALGAVCEAVDTVFGPGPRRAFVGVRPPGHHCSASHPSGFCWVNNVHVGIMHGALTHDLTHAAIIDFDLHHGDGSQAITWQHNARAATTNKNHAPWKRTSIGYFSLHDINSYPCEMGDEDKVRNASVCIDNAHGQSIWNVHLQSWKTEQDFWALYENTYAVLLDKTRKYLQNQACRLRAINQVPKAAIFFSAGFDASEWESAGMQRHQVNVPTEFYARITQDVIKIAAEEGLAVDGRVISVLEGGYSDRALFSGVLSHLSGMVGDQKPIKTEQESNGLGYEMGHRIGAAIKREELVKVNSLASTYPYDPSWWACGQLEQLEQPVELPLPQRKPRAGTPPTYSSPTQASTARVADPVRMRRSLSGLATSYSKAIQRAPTPPPPEVFWDVAAKELCNVLIPSGRQTDSCKPEDLNAEASRARRDRQSELLGYPPPTPTAHEGPSKMSLRERKPRPIGFDDESEPLPRTRRRQVSTPLTSPVKGARGTPSQSGGPDSARRTSRRLSGTILSPQKEEPPPVPPIPPMAPTSSRPSSRPSSRSASRAGRAQNSDKVQVKKKAPASARKEATPRASRSPRKASTPARTAKPAPIGPDTPTPSTRLPLSHDGASDVDNLASGMKKIKINLITQSQKDAKKKANAEGERHDDFVSQDAVTATTSETTPSPESKFSKPNLNDKRSTGQLDAPPSISLSEGLSTPTEELYSPGTTSSTSAPSVPADISPAMPNIATHSASNGSDFFISYQPEGPEPATMSQQEPLKWLPPNVLTPSASTPVATPSPVKKQSNLFQYTSGIPFAPRPEQEGQKNSGSASTPLPGTENKPGPKAVASTVWEVPKTPRK